MLSAVRRRLSYANVVATLALVFAMSGGALAASHYLLTSTGQISPKVLKALRGKSGAQGAPGAAGAQGLQGAAGAQGPQGSQGPQGEPGATGAAGPAGPQGATGATGASGKEGSPWTAGGTLPSGKTETGTWAVSGPKEFFASISVSLASFAIPLAAPPAISFIGPGEGKGEEHENLPAGCEGNDSKPQADPGNLCVYETAAVNIEQIEAHASTAGAHASVNVVSFEEAFNVFGTWAVTAK